MKRKPVSDIEGCVGPNGDDTYGVTRKRRETARERDERIVAGGVEFIGLVKQAEALLK